MEFGKKLEDFTNEELSNIITAFYNCKYCGRCPGDGGICGFAESGSGRGNFALEVAKGLKG